MDLKILWPGKTRDPALRTLQSEYLDKIARLGKCRVIETREARGVSEKDPGRILDIEAAGLEKHLQGEHLVCLTDRGDMMTSRQFAGFLEKTSLGQPYPITFAVGGFLGLADRLLKRAGTRMSLSKMTFSHELTRIVLLEQIYRALSILKGLHYAK